MIMLRVLLPVLVTRRLAAVDDASLKELCGEAALQGMVEEMKNLEVMEAGDLYTQSEYEASGLGGTCRTIPSRWVTADKGKDDLGNPVVRSRIVLKDISKRIRFCESFRDKFTYPEFRWAESSFVSSWD